MKKEDIRRLWEGQKEEGFPMRPGVLAEKLRQLSSYRTAAALYVTPSALLRQVRINSLLDGKALICPTPSLKKGFFLLHPYTIPFARLSHAVTPKGMDEYGEILSSADQVSDVRIGLAVVDCLAADRHGCLVGDGNGFFDLALAILSAWKMMEAGYHTVAVLPEKAISDDPIAPSPWDCFADLLLTECQVHSLAGPGKGKDLPLFWEQLPERRIRKITPLWKLWQTKKEQ